MASWLAENMTKEGHQVGVLSGDMTVDQRAAVIDRYRQGKEKVLVTTNVCSRGEQIKVLVALVVLGKHHYCLTLDC